MMKMKCPWIGCDGVIDVLKEVKTGKWNRIFPEKVPWSTTTISCPKCHNPVGSFEISPSYLITICGEGKGEFTIRNPSTNETIILPKSVSQPKQMYKVLNKYLKEWARHEEE